MAIQQHPVPQDISNYKFRLIGDMTIKQFAALGISIVLAVIIYSSPMPFFFKYPISFFLLLLGVGTAFVPFQGRTLDVWIVAFIKSIYSPTQYIWKHGQETPVSTPDSTNNPQTPVINISAPATETSIENTQQDTASSTSITNTQILPADNNSQTVITQTSTKPTDQIPTVNIQPTTVEQTNPTPEPITPTESTTLKNQSDTSDTNISNKSPIAPDQESEVQSQPTNEHSDTTESISSSEINNSSSATPQPDTSLPIPFTPSTPNTLVGLTLTPQGQILDGVLVEIKNQSITVRATRSNKLGQFLFVRPLENGLYQIIAEKDGFTFENYSIQLNGEIINPLRIQAIK